MGKFNTIRYTSPGETEVNSQSWGKKDISHIEDHIVQKIWQLKLFFQSVFGAAKMPSPG